LRSPLKQARTRAVAGSVATAEGFAAGAGAARCAAGEADERFAGVEAGVRGGALRSPQHQVRPAMAKKRLAPGRLLRKRKVHGWPGSIPHVLIATFAEFMFE